MNQRIKLKWLINFSKDESCLIMVEQVLTRIVLTSWGELRISSLLKSEVNTKKKLN